MSRLWFRLQAMLRRLWDGGARDKELGEEIRAYVELDTESKIRSGMTPQDARREALIELGGAEQVKERVREDRAGARWESIFQDIRYAMRSLGQARGFSFSVIGSLSLAWRRRSWPSRLSMERCSVRFQVYGIRIGS